MVFRLLKNLFHVHDWTKWEKVRICLVSDDLINPTRREVPRYRRECKSCGIPKFKTLYVS